MRDAFNNRGNVLRELKRLEEALASYDKAIALKPDYTEAFNNRGLALQELNLLDDALASYDRALALKPDYADAFTNRGIALQELKRVEEALASFDRALAAKADHAGAFGGAAACVIRLCDWDRRMWFARELDLPISGKKSIITPFLLLCYSGKPTLQLQCARNYIDDKVHPRPFWTGATWRHDKVRIAYLSADFHQHATAYLMAELFERHDARDSRSSVCHSVWMTRAICAGGSLRRLISFTMSARKAMRKSPSSFTIYRWTLRLI